MNESLKSRCSLFVSNRDMMKTNFKWGSSLIYPLCAYLYAEKGLELDSVKIKASREIIKKSSGIFSNFRGTLQNVLATMLSMEIFPEAKFSDIQSVYSKLKGEFFTSSYLVLTAFVIALMTSPDNFDETVLKTRRIYKLMKSEHPFLTSGEDCTFAALFALSDKYEDDIVNEAENCFVILKQKFFSSNAVQSLSHVLALGEEKAESKCARALEIYDRLKARGMRYGTTYELPTLGVLALTGSDINAVVEDINDVNEYLKASKGFGAFSIGSKQRLMYAAMLTASEYSAEVSNGVAENAMRTAAFNSVMSMIIAQQVAVMVAISASASASSNAGN